MSEPLIAGTTIKLNGQDYILPPLNVDTLETYLPVIQGWAQPPATLLARLVEVCEVIHAGLLRNYPELPLKEVKQAVDLNNFQDMVDVLLASSGLARVEPGEPGAGSVLTGAKSGPESPASPAGPGNTSAGV